MAIIQL